MQSLLDLAMASQLHHDRSAATHSPSPLSLRSLLTRLRRD
jgi:hypothetical protein